MFSKFIAAAALTVVSAADVPLFSSNDDYDEINLNIRMLSNGTATPVPTNITIVTAMTGDFGTSDPTDLAPGGAKYTGFNAGFCAYMATLDTTSTSCVVTAVALARRQLSEAEKRRLAPMSISVTSKMLYPTAAAATTGATTVNSATIVPTALAASLNNQAGFSGVTVTAATATATAPTSGGAAAPAAAPSPSPSSNAAKVAVSTLAALSAFVASLL
jgi:hypothetical protein